MSNEALQPPRLRVRSVKVELLRAGPAHNQLLSPLTPYLGICNGAEAGIVTVPFEHHAFMRRLAQLRSTGEDTRERAPALREMGMAVAGVLGAIPHLPGTLDGDWAGEDDLVHLRLVLSASELAVLPFELSKAPGGGAEASEDWLSLQARVPVVVTRRTREVPASRSRWPSRARILFVSGDPRTVPFEAHRQALVDAVQPYLRSAAQRGTAQGDGRREDFEDALTVLRDASFDDVVSACAAARYTHVHVLAHGATDPDVDEPAYGLVLNRPSGEPEVIAGSRLASALACLVDGRVHRPTVATLAACDGGNLGSVLVTGASMAHALHRAGIPLVVASQFPLSKDGSELVARQLYPGLLAGWQPLPLLHRLRTDLHARYATRSHDWASLVVYESFADDLAPQLEEVRYRQAIHAMNMACERLLCTSPRDANVQAGAPAAAAPADRQALADELRRRADGLPVDGPYRLECLGVRAAGYKRLAEAEFDAAAGWPAGSTQRTACLQRCLSHLEEARQHYGQAAAGFLLRGKGDVHDASTLHWVLGQQLCLSAVLGRPARAGAWETARLCAEVHLEDSDLQARGWGLSTLAELWMLRLADPALLRLRDADPARWEAERDAAARQALRHLADMLQLARSRQDDRIVTTRRQLQRYVRWWGDPGLEQQVRLLPAGGADRADWAASGIVPLALQLLELLPAEADPRDEPPGDPGGAGDAGSPRADGVAAGAATPDARVAPPASAAVPEAAPAVTPMLSLPQGAAGAAHFSIHMLPAAHGDCLWIEYGHGRETHRVLVDCGTAGTWAGELRPRIEALPPGERHFELFILTHIDDDHIGGAIPMLRQAQALRLRFGDVWFNGWRHLSEFGPLNARQGEEFSAELVDGRHPWNAWTQGRAIVVPDAGAPPVATLPGGMTLTLLSPSADKLRTLAPRWAQELAELGRQPGDDFLAADEGRLAASTDVPALAASEFRPDPAANNGSSIAVLAEYGGRSVLLGADAHAPLLQAALQRLLRARGIERLRVDAFKLPHHGSQGNLSMPLLALLDCRRFLVSTSGARFRHPDRVAIARALRHGGPGATLYFNHRSTFNQVWSRSDLQQQYGYRAEFPPDGQAGLKVVL